MFASIDRCLDQLIALHCTLIAVIVWINSDQALWIAIHGTLPHPNHNFEMTQCTKDIIISHRIIRGKGEKYYHWPSLLLLLLLLPLLPSTEEKTIPIPPVDRSRKKIVRRKSSAKIHWVVRKLHRKQPDIRVATVRDPTTNDKAIQRADPPPPRRISLGSRL